MRVAVIGGGPSGLVTLKYLLEAHQALQVDAIEAKLFESENSIGGTFKARTYEDAELVSSRQLTTFSDFRCKTELDFLSTARYLEYLDDYCTHFKLWEHISLSCKVEALDRRLDGSHLIIYSTARGIQTWECDAVAVCTGLHVIPNFPFVKGMDKIPTVMHSSEFKGRHQLGKDSTVLILGSGETASDIGFLAATSPTKEVILCHRDGFHLAPKRNPHPRIVGTRGKGPGDAPAVPIDVCRASLFDTTYVHTFLRRSNALWIYYDIYVRCILWVSWGTTHGKDQWIGGKPPGWSVSQTFFNKSEKIGPYINNHWRPKRPGGVLQYIRSLIIKSPPVNTRGRRVELAPWPEQIDKDGRVEFCDNGRPEYLRMKSMVVKPDIVVFCTGYVSAFPFMNQETTGADVREIWARKDPSVGFIGFVRPSLGAIPPLAEMQAQLWILNLAAPERLPLLCTEDEAHYRLTAPKDARVTCGVDHESYTYQLALDMRSAPSLLEILRLSCRGPLENRWRLPLTWALGANYNTKFRLRGPWKWDGAIDVMTGELWETVRRRSIFFGRLSLAPNFGVTRFLIGFQAILHYLLFQY